MKKIYKYHLPLNGSIMTIKDPVEKVLSIQSQGGIPMLWAITDTDLEASPMDIISIGTGWDIPEECKEYLGTAQDADGYVWHYFVYKTKKMEKAPKEEKILIEDLAVLAQIFGQTGSAFDETAQQFCKILAGPKR